MVSCGAERRKPITRPVVSGLSRHAMKRSKSMYFYYLAVGLAVISNLFYHLSQKLTPTSANPALAVAVTYLVAMAVLRRRGSAASGQAYSARRA